MNASPMGMPLSFSFGTFANRTIRAELVELQKADLGRKYARKDRRPLDPPPAVLLRLYETLRPGTPAEVEREIEICEDTQTLGFVCHVDLFPVPSEYLNMPLTLKPIPISRPDKAHHDHDVVASLGACPIRESSSHTQHLAGEMFVHSSCVDYHGRKSLLFVFSNLSVKKEGTFFLRYRAFDVFSRSPAARSIPVLAECYGGPFRVYSTKDFPGLRASTDLSKHISYYGVRINTRETPRKRRKTDPSQDQSRAARIEAIAPAPAASLDLDPSPSLPRSTADADDPRPNVCTFADQSSPAGPDVSPHRTRASGAVARSSVVAAGPEGYSAPSRADIVGHARCAGA
ncbi:hypothetical protein WOLCODRAFT_136233 [Wolfiporia cocos MD-104 SS10]|uniref:Velvet domain-containing protein n=1 Tax=Wolfiporia cocos (strain MD-104) TaxID=742152 RepID=A0A2H3J821_WOLCO|nr:hypothetical protein WOLCODRAFT_136233 [Wolfiporia cocos MD-104 SS10]